MGENICYKMVSHVHVVLRLSQS